jgi:hypothetical protein
MLGDGADRQSMLGVLGQGGLILVSCLHAGADAFMLEALFRNEAWGFMLQPVSQENERAVCQSMVDGCRCESSDTSVHIGTAYPGCACYGSKCSRLLMFMRDS